MSLLEAKGLEVHYGGIRAVKGIDLQVEDGELVCLIGANGAGKSSTLKAICGLVARSGTVSYAGTNIAGTPVHDLPRRGLVMVPEGRGIFPQLTVAENLAMGAYTRKDASVKEDVARQYDMFPRLKERRAQTAGTLSGGEQQMLAMGRALMARPKLLMLDEPSLGLAPVMVDVMFDAISQLHQQGLSILLIEQNVAESLALAQRGYVLENGEVVLEGEAQALSRDERVRQAYLGL